MKSQELEDLHRRLQERKKQLQAPGANRQLVEQAERVERLYGQPTVRSRGYRTEARQARIRREAQVELINEALRDLRKGDPSKALSILGE
ncbi:MAG: hypothetical protein ABIB97_00110 [Patescibacteria group bacterium]